jgi:hypothetical protein
MACGKKDARETADTPPSVPAKLSLSPTPAAADSDVAAHGAGMPAGYVAQTDDPTASIRDISYTADGKGRWEVRTGPAHILYTTKDVTQKVYRVSATFEQFEAPVHPEAFGVFIGGAALDTAAKRQYTYFLVRGDGKYMVKVRNGANVRTITEWTPHPAIPVQGAGGKAVYGVTIDVDGKVAKVSVNGQPVTMFSGPRIPMEGIAGVRVNHNLHLMVTPAVVTLRR